MVFDWFSLYGVFIVNEYSKQGLSTNGNITVFKKCLFGKMFPDICMLKLYKVHIYVFLHIWAHLHSMYVCACIYACIYIKYLYNVYVNITCINIYSTQAYIGI